MSRLALCLAAVALSATYVAPAIAQPDWHDARRVEVRLANFSFTPSTIHLRAGQPVVLHLVNVGSGGHDFAAREFFAAATMRDPGAAPGGRVELGKGERREIAHVPRAGSYPH